MLQRVGALRTSASSMLLGGARALWKEVVPWVLDFAGIMKSLSHPTNQRLLLVHPYIAPFCRWARPAHWSNCRDCLSPFSCFNTPSSLVRPAIPGIARFDVQFGSGGNGCLCGFTGTVAARVASCGIWDHGALARPPLRFPGRYSLPVSSPACPGFKRRRTFIAAFALPSIPTVIHSLLQFIHRAESQTVTLPAKPSPARGPHACQCIDPYWELPITSRPPQQQRSSYYAGKASGKRLEGEHLWRI